MQVIRVGCIHLLEVKQREIHAPDQTALIGDCERCEVRVRLDASE
jgi:hypothetical protein